MKLIKDRVTLNECMFYFQKITVSEEEASVIQSLLESQGWATIQIVMAESNLSYEEAKIAADSMVTKGVTWWTEINGEKWYRLKPMSKKEMKQWDKAFQERGLTHKKWKRKSKNRRDA